MPKSSDPRHLQVEYIEFMKIMGIARFIICNERSDDEVDLLQVLISAHTFV